MTEAVSDILIRIKNAYLAGHKSLEAPYSRAKQEVVKILTSEGFVKKAEVRQKKGKKILELTLLYKGKKPALEGVKRISKPSLRVYVKKGKIKKVLAGTGISLISTSQGLMTGEKARKKGLGGELIGEVW